MATLPIVKYTRPSILNGMANGQLDPDVLVNVGDRGWLNRHTADNWRALVAACLAIGLPLTYTYGGCYRTYQEQLTLWNQRWSSTVQYITVNGVRRETTREWWDGKWWWLKPSGPSTMVARAGKPGTSKHGEGSAVDTAFDKDTSDGIGPDDAAYIKAHPKFPEFVQLAVAHGFSFEDPSEPWHIRDVSGDSVPAATAAWLGKVVPQLPPFDPAAGVWGLYPVGTKRVLKLGTTGDDVKYLQGVLKLKAGQTGIGTIDGSFGPRTEEAVRTFQAFFGFVVDGWVGQQTWGMIDYCAVH